MAEPAQAPTLRGLRVLIVEDEALVAFQLEDMRPISVAPDLRAGSAKPSISWRRRQSTPPCPTSTWRVS